MDRAVETTSRQCPGETARVLRFYHLSIGRWQNCRKMARPPLDRHRATAAELKARRAADDAGQPYLLFFDGDDRQVIRPLDSSGERIIIGRSPGATIRIDWDKSVSATHAEIEYVGEAWVISDDGLSTNGTFVNQRFVGNRRRLRHDDLIKVGTTEIALQARTSETPEPTGPPDPRLAPPELTDAQRRVLVALCRPFVLDRRGYPPTNQQIANELFLSLVTVKAHLRHLNQLFGVGDLIQTQKRAELVRRATDTGAVSRRDYE